MYILVAAYKPVFLENIRMNKRTTDTVVLVSIDTKASDFDEFTVTCAPKGY